MTVSSQRSEVLKIVVGDTLKVNAIAARAGGANTNIGGLQVLLLMLLSSSTVPALSGVQ